MWHSWFDSLKAIAHLKKKKVIYHFPRIPYHLYWGLPVFLSNWKELKE